jgi:hypothetical protein
MNGHHQLNSLCARTDFKLTLWSACAKERGQHIEAEYLGRLGNLIGESNFGLTDVANYAVNP